MPWYNPANTEILVVLDAPAKENTPIGIYDMLGRLRKEDLIRQGKKEKAIKVESLNEGIYFVNFKDGSHSTQRLLILRE